MTNPTPARRQGAQQPQAVVQTVVVTTPGHIECADPTSPVTGPLPTGTVFRGYCYDPNVTPTLVPTEAAEIHSGSTASAPTRLSGHGLSNTELTTLYNPGITISPAATGTQSPTGRQQPQPRRGEPTARPAPSSGMQRAQSAGFTPPRPGHSPRNSQSPTTAATGGEQAHTPATQTAAGATPHGAPGSHPPLPRRAPAPAASPHRAAPPAGVDPTTYWNRDNRLGETAPQAATAQTPGQRPPRNLLRGAASDRDLGNERRLPNLPALDQRPRARTQPASQTGVGARASAHAGVVVPSPSRIFGNR